MVKPLSKRQAEHLRKMYGPSWPNVTDNGKGEQYVGGIWRRDLDVLIETAIVYSAEEAHRHHSLCDAHCGQA